MQAFYATLYGISSSISHEVVSLEMLDIVHMFVLLFLSYPRYRLIAYTKNVKKTLKRSKHH